MGVVSSPLNRATTRTAMKDEQVLVRVDCIHGDIAKNPAFRQDWPAMNDEIASGGRSLGNLGRCERQDPKTAALIVASKAAHARLMPNCHGSLRPVRVGLRDGHFRKRSTFGFWF